MEFIEEKYQILSTELVAVEVQFCKNIDEDNREFYETRINGTYINNTLSYDLEIARNRYFNYVNNLREYGKLR